MVKIKRIGVGHNYEVRWNYGLTVEPTVQKEVLVLRQLAHHPTESSIYGNKTLIPIQTEKNKLREFIE